ncbi:dTDP-4-dehydrorhamnose reductase [Kordiimonas aquimaris]|uniref:dTDP-4-dehydrorhamnose reductase n=1 Tax=Kordiimonas aquimaris TaxID=707591 RepID=UPI0021D3670D|nr:dTDP-4-dehydrorhamnose reductase [Kordiimonas aquimaris]
MNGSNQKSAIFVAGNNGQVALSLKEAAKARNLPLETHGRPEFDLSKTAALTGLIAEQNPAAIVNAAAYTAVDNAENEEELAFAINAAGAEALAAIAYKLDIPFIHISTDYVFDGLKIAPYNEDDVTEPTGAYGRSKLEGERLVMAANPNAVILRTAWVYSPFGKNFLKTMLSLASRESLGVVADQIGNPTYAPDIATAVLDILQMIQSLDDPSSLGGIYHMTGTGSTSWHGFAVAIFDTISAIGLAKPVVNAITTADYPTPAERPANSRLDCSKLEATFSVKLPDWKTSTAICVKRLSEMNQLG